MHSDEQPPPRPETPDDWARLLKSEWEERAASRSPEWFIASGPGWEDPVLWKESAARDVELWLTLCDRDRLKRSHVLEIGCGLGRLAPHLAAVAASYTGFDISRTFVEAARKQCAGVPNARFFESQGLDVPSGARDRSYALVIAHAVFIHCPMEVTRSLLASARALTVRDGELRFHLRGDPADLEGILSLPDAQPAHDAAMAAETAEVPDRHLADSPHYMGTKFTYARAREFLKEFGPADFDLIRLDLGLIHCRIVPK